MLPSIHADSLAALRAEVRRIEGLGKAGSGETLSFDLPAVDGWLAGEGLSARGLHDVTGASPHLADDAAATLFLAWLAGRKARGDPRGQILWALGRRDLFAPGLMQAGLPPDRLLYAECRDDSEVLAVMEEGLRHGGLAAVVGEVGRCAMAAARRLQLAAEEGGTMALMLRRWRKTGRDPLAEPSPAMTRWRIGSASSVPLPVDGVGRPCWRVELTRQRGGNPCSWIMEGPDEEGRLALLPLPSDRADRMGEAA